MRPAQTRDPETGPSPRAAVALAVGLLIAVVSVLGWPSPGAAQSPGSGIGAGAQLQFFDFTDSRSARIRQMHLLTVPVGARVAVSDRFRVEVGGYWARGEVERPGGRTSTLSGLTDASIRASWDPVDALTLTAVGRLPTGEDAYTVEELDVLGVLASDLFPFRVSNWGTGGGYGLQASTGQDFGAVSTAVSVGYFRSGEFDPLEDQLVAYRPGDNVNVRAAMNFAVGGASRLSLQGGFRSYAEDELQDANVFDAGNRWNVRGRYSFPVGGRGAGFVYGGFHRRDGGTAIELLRPSADQDLVLAGGGLRLRVGGVRVRPSVDARLLRRGDGTSEGQALRVGGEAEWTLEGVTLVPSVRGHLGELVVRQGTESGFVGFDLGLTIRTGGGLR